FIRARITLDPAELVDDKVRARLDALPDSIHLKGDRAPISYEIRDGRGIARVTLREGQARRLRAGEITPLDRPLHFAVRRGNHPPILADTLDDVRDALERQPRGEGTERGGNGGNGGRGGKGGRGGNDRRGGPPKGGRKQRHQRRRR
ncbi:MAG TPA: hypothetical protein VFU00_05260, partial [Gemmatimonadales bacterium]|nr:hypothetical protein [Gemmatimonadales bacterium]